MSTAAPTVEPLRARVLRGVGWKAASQVILQVSRLAVGIALARLLAPHDYGVAAMVVVFSSLVIVFSDMALGAALVQRKTLTEEDRSTVFWTALGGGLVFTCIGLALAGPIAAFYGEPEVRSLFAVLSLSFVVTSLATTQNALLVREMNFRTLELCLIAATLSGGAVALFVAIRGYGPWAVIAQHFTVAVVTTILLWRVSRWRPSFTYSRESLRSLGGFSLKVLGQRLLYYVHANVDNLLVGRVLGPAALGAYAVAYNVMLVPFSRIAVPITEVLFPAFAELQDDRSRMTSSWVRATRVIAALSAPSLLGMIVLAPEFVAVVLGDRWSAAAPVIRILAFVGLLQSLQALNSNVLLALGRAGTLLRYSVVFFCCHLIAFVIGLHWGIVGVAAGYAISSALVEPLYFWLTARALGTSVWVLARGIREVLLAAVAMALALVLVRYLLLEDASLVLRFFLLVPLGAALFVPLCAWRSPEVLAELRGLRRRAAGA